MTTQPDWGDSITVSDAAITVERELTRKRPVLVAECRLTSDRDHPATVRVVDEFPDDLGVTDAAFHEDATPEQGEAETGAVWFEVIVEPSEPVEITYGLRLDEPPSAPYDPPRIERVLPVDEADVGEGPPMVRSASAGGPDLASGDDVDRAIEEADIPAASGTTPGGPDDGIEPIGDLSARGEAAAGTGDGPAADPGGTDPGDIDTTAATGAGVEIGGPDGDAGGPDDDGAAEGVADGGELELDDGRATGDRDPVAELVDAVRTGRLTEGQQAVLRRGLVGDATSDTDARLQHVESKLASLEAYVETLESFIDDQGTASEALDGLRTDLDDVQRELSALRESQDDADADRAELWTAVDDVNDDLRAVDDTVETLRDGLDGVRSAVEAVGDEVEAAGDRRAAELSAVRSDVDDLQDDVTELRSVIDSVSQVFTPEEVPGGEVEE